MYEKSASHVTNLLQIIRSFLVYFGFLFLFWLFCSLKKYYFELFLHLFTSGPKQEVSFWGLKWCDLWEYEHLILPEFDKFILYSHQFSSVQFSRSDVSDSLWPHRLQHARLPYPSPTLRACSNSCPLSQWCHPITSSSIVPFSSFNLSQHQGLFQWVSSLHQVAKVLELQLQHQSFQWIFRADFL